MSTSSATEAGRPGLSCKRSFGSRFKQPLGNSSVFLSSRVQHFNLSPASSPSPPCKKLRPPIPGSSRNRRIVTCHIEAEADTVCTKSHRRTYNRRPRSRTDIIIPHDLWSCTQPSSLLPNTHVDHVHHMPIEFDIFSDAILSPRGSEDEQEKAQLVFNNRHHDPPKENIANKLYMRLHEHKNNKTSTGSTVKNKKIVHDGNSDPPGGSPPSPPPPGLPTPIASSRWMGLQRGVTWNANGLTVNDPGSKSDKIRALVKLMKNYDYAIATETHSTIAISSWYEQYLNTRGFQVYWCHQSSRNSGVAIIIKDAFLRNFAMARPTTIVSGHCIALKLTTTDRRGLDIFGCYFPAGSSALRKNSMDALQRNMNPKSHSIVAGDFNITPE